MFVRSTGLNFIISSLFVAAIGACGGIGGGCGACGSELPLPPPGNAPNVHGMPADQTVEGGAQIRVTASGFQKLKNLVPEIANSSLAPVCIAKGSVDLGFISLASYCDVNSTGCAGKACAVVPSVAFTDLTPNGNNALNVRVGLNIDTTIPISVFLIGSCNLRISTTAANPDTPIIADLNLGLGIKRPDGELDVKVTGVNQIDIGGIDFISDGGVICDIAAGAGDLIVTVGNFFTNLIGPILTGPINNLVQSILPNPLGIANMIDAGALVAGASPGTEALMEGRIVPGGFVSTANGGLSLGVITGLNADQHPETRDVGLTSEPAKCVPPFLPPDLSAPAPGAALSTTSYVEAGTTVTRPTFTLPLAAEFNGSQDSDGNPNTIDPDVMMGISSTTLGLAGHHLVSSGGMCLGVGTSLIPQLNVGTIGILVPSVEELQSDNGNDPLLLVTRPQRPLKFTINDDTANKALTLGIEHLEVDFYAFLFERYVRAFTLDLTMNVDIGLTFEQTATGAVIKPVLGGISADAVTIKVLNSEFAQESPEDLEAVLPSVFDLVTPLLGDLPPIDVPTFAGFTLENLSIARIATPKDDFLALKATLGNNAALASLNKLVTVELLKQRAHALESNRVQIKPRLVSVTTPEPKLVRSALKGTGGAMPQVMFDVAKVDSQGRELEYSYNLENGMFRPFLTPGPGGLVIADKAFAWQGKYEIGLKARVKGDYTTTSEVSRTPVTIDSVGPRFLSDKAAWEGDQYAITMFDIVSGNVVQWAIGRVGERGPETAWHDGGYAMIDRELLEQYAVNGEVVLWSRDEAGNTNHALIAPFHGQPGEGSGCECNSSGPSPGGIVLMVLVGGFLVVRRRRRFSILALARKSQLLTQLALFVGLSITLSVMPGCSCGSASSCELFTDCPDCPEGEIAFCIDGTCVCSDDILIGKLGAYSDVATGSDGSIWVSAYHNQYGDLVVAQADPTVSRIPDTAWEWVDGVPDGPVIVPQSVFRGGIGAKGQDVGMYTSIAVSTDNTPQVTYFDRDAGSLKFAARSVDGVWTNHVIDAGSGELGEAGALIGMYTALSLRGDDGRPGVAYLAHVADANGRRAEVRFAASQVVHPTSSADWMTFVVDTAALPEEDPENPNIYPLPEGLGLFVDVARMPDQSPAVVYYDRSAGELKLSKFDTSTGAFGAPVVLDGTGDIDAGWSPSVAVDPSGVVHVAYVNATKDDLVYITDAAGAQRETVDDGLRIVGTTVDGLPKPEYHFVGDDAGLVLANGGQLPMIAYQDATTQELMLATKQQDGSWLPISLAGHTDPWPGGYGFFASSVLSGTDLVISNWVIDQPIDENWVEVFRRQVALE